MASSMARKSIDVTTTLTTFWQTPFEGDFSSGSAKC